MDSERWRQVEQLYHSAEELRPERREAFLALACEGDKELQADIWSLLNQTPSTELLGGNVWKQAEDLLTDLVSERIGPRFAIRAVPHRSDSWGWRHGRSLPSVRHTAWSYCCRKDAPLLRVLLTLFGVLDFSVRVVRRLH